jgi:hypothetical protein
VLVAFLFSAGSSVFVLSNLSGGAGELAVCSAILFALCLVNCVLVSSWERAEDAGQAQPSMAVHWNVSPAIARWIALGMMVVTGVISLVWWQEPVGWISLATTLSLVLLAILERLADRLPLNQRHVLADMALLTPIMFLLLRPAYEL